jgi:hypothetical protein
MMKRILYLFALLLFIGAAHAVVTTEPTIDVTLLRFEPVPAEPGDTIDVWLQLTNTGSLAADNVQLTVDDSYPFTPLTATDASRTIGTLASQSEYVAKVRVRIDRNAPQGEATLRVGISTNGRTTRYEDVPIMIESGTASLAIMQVETDPEELSPGSKATLRVTVKNVEEVLLRDVTINLQLADTVFAPLGSTNQQKVSRLDAGELHTFSFVIITEPDAASSVYRIPVSINSTTDDGTHIAQEETLGVLVRAAPELTVVVDETNVFTDGNDGAVTLRLVNKGLSEVKFAEVSLLNGTGYEHADSIRTQYVGNIDSDDFETVEFAVKPTEDDFVLNVQVTYRDSLNNPYTEQFSVPVQAKDPESSGGAKWLIIIVLIVAVAGIVWWRRSRKKR